MEEGNSIFFDDILLKDTTIYISNLKNGKVY